jgi:probable 2-oxoglutarate dehydrogenase E1 component DHKTD1
LNLLQREEVAALNPARYGLTDPEKEYVIDGIVWHDHEPASSQWPLKRIVSHMRAVYVGAIAYEYMHSPDKSERLWFSHLLESEGEKERAGRYGEESKRRIWELLAKSEVLDTFLQDKFPNLKRYGLEGAESMIPALDSLFRVAAAGKFVHLIWEYIISDARLTSWRRTRRHWNAPPWTAEPPYRPPSICTASSLSQDTRQL